VCCVCVCTALVAAADSCLEANLKEPF